MILLRLVLTPLLRSIHEKTSRVLVSVTSVKGCNKNAEINLYSLQSSHRTLATKRSNFKTVKNCIEKDSDALRKWKLLSDMNFKCTEDAKPFFKLPISTLLHIHRVTKNDAQNGFCENRLYYISEQIKCPVIVLSEPLAKRTFIYSLTFDWLASSLKVLLDMGVPGERILRDMWVLKYHKDTIAERLQRVKDMGIEKLYPWMVRCSEHILNRYISISKETKDILGDTKTTKVYLSDRLNTTLDVVEEICVKLPALNTIRVTKVKSFLDFLEKEGFSVEDIKSKPRILTSSQKTVQKRLEKLRALGLTEINLNVLCRSRKHFTKYVESIEAANIDINVNKKES